VLLGVQLGPGGCLKGLEHVSEYDADFELWAGAVHKSQSEGGGGEVGLGGFFLGYRARGVRGGLAGTLTSWSHTQSSKPECREPEAKLHNQKTPNLPIPGEVVGA
jgi:hypothetical protein